MTRLNYKAALLTLLFFFALIELTFATNFGFLPGDCCFHTTLNKEFIDQLQDKQDPVFDYVRPKNASVAFCGYGGFYKMKIGKMPAGFKANLKKVYDLIRKDHRLKLSVYPETKWDDALQKDVKTGKIIKEELNPIHVFFVNGDYDWKRFSIGLKYNENWAAEMQVVAKHKLEQTTLDLFVDTGEAVMREWRDAKQVAKLNAKCPDLSTRHHDLPIESSGKLKAIVLPTGEIKEYFSGRLDFYIVDEDGITKVPGSQAKDLKGGLFQP